MRELLRKVRRFLLGGRSLPSRVKSGRRLKGRAESHRGERRRLFERRRWTRQKVDFFSNISHELRTPLTLILAPLDAILSGACGPMTGKQEEALQVAHNNATRLLQMVTELLDLSRLEAGKVEVRRESFDVVALTRAILSDFGPMLQQKRLTGTLDADPSHAVVYLDRYLYERILFNLLANAIKFTPEGGAVRVHLEIGGGRLRLEVTDTGVGIADEDLEMLFQRFHQLEHTPMRRSEGTGLGLALVKEFAEELGGGIAVTSKKGEGTTFTVDLKVPEGEEEAAAPQRNATGTRFTRQFAAALPASRIASGPEEEERPLVVVAEDNEELAAFLLDLLQESCDLHYARDGAEALSLVRNERPDLVLCDVMMPTVDGLRVCRELKADPATAAIPVVLLTAQSDRRALLQGWEAGADEYLFKPFHPTELLTRVRSLLDAAALRKQAEEVARKNERQLRELFEHSPDAILVEDLDGNVLDANPAACRLHGLTCDALIGRNVRDLVPPHHEERVVEDIRRLLAGEISSVERFVWGQKSDPVPVEVRASRITYGDRPALLLKMRDITDRKKAEEEVRRLNAELEQRVRERTAELEVKNRQLEREVNERKLVEEAARRAQRAAETASRAKSAFLANMSHEIRTPLTGVIGFASLLAKEVAAEHREFARLIERSGRRLMDTLNSVLTIAKLEAEQVEVELDVLRLAGEVEEIVELSQPLAEEKGLVLSFRVEPGAEAALVRLDSGALSSILYNLIGNAVKFTDEGEIEVSVAGREGHVELDVRDTGVGIDPAFIPHLFDTFRQESSGLSRTHQGSGLGLAITRRLVELMGGRIRVESEKGKGSTFTVSFPQVKSEEDERPAEESVSLLAPAQSARVLVVEDNEDSAVLIGQVLESTCSVTIAMNAEEALRRLQAECDFDLILMDINLGSGLDGAEVLTQLRGIPSYRDTPVVALTAYALPGDREYFLEQGFTTYLSKPFQVDELLEVVASLLPAPAVPSEEGEG